MAIPRNADHRSTNSRNTCESRRGDCTKVNDRDNVPRRRLHKRRVDWRHILTAILTVMAVGRAWHRIATLHRLFRRCHSKAVEAVGRKSGSGDYHDDCLGKTHRKENRGIGGNVATYMATAQPTNPTTTVERVADYESCTSSQPYCWPIGKPAHV
jgi:hypothetical protein